MNIATTPEFYVSYAWEPDSEKIVESFETACQARGFKLLRDKNDIGFKGIISDFMKSLGQGKFVLVVLSDKYLKSDNCMFELLEIAKNGHFYDRIFPITTDSADFYRPIGRIRYVKFWEEQIKELNEAMTELASQADLNGIRQSIDHYTKIRAMFGELTNIIKDMNSLTVNYHLTTSFDEVFQIAEADLVDEANSENSTLSIPESTKSSVIEKKKQDRIIANLMKVSFNDTLYVAKLAIDRDEVIERSWETTFKLKRKASDRKVALFALHETGKPFDREFQIANKTVLSFANLADRSKAFVDIIEPATVESYSVSDYLSINSDFRPTFISLLKLCLNAKLAKKEIEWVDDEDCYRFKTGLLAKEKKITWKGVKQATRTVIFERFNKDKSLIVGFKHLAFKTAFIQLKAGFYIAINPTWSVTKDGKHPSMFAADDIANQKRMENNQAVQNHFRFIQYCLINSISEGDDYSLLSLSESEIFDTL